MKSLKTLLLKLKGISVYRNILNDEIIQKFLSLINSTYCNFDDFICSYGDFFHTISNTGKINISEYLYELILYDENYFTKNVRDIESCENIKKAVAFEINLLLELTKISADKLKKVQIENSKDDIQKEIINSLPNFENIFSHFIFSNEIFDIGCLYDFYIKNGFGIFAKYIAFKWEKNVGLSGIENVDKISFDDLVGYNIQKEILIENTMQFLNGYKANNILLYGDRGTGKSSSVKALLNEYFNLGLRLIEVSISGISDLPAIAKKVSKSNLKFIIFIDDLVFSGDEENYTYLKSILEGAVEEKPGNIIIYATSNRRHLIKESFSERMSDDVNASDTMQEKLSISDRFGITITYLKSDKESYLEIVNVLAKRKGINIDTEKLNAEAMKWQARYNGMSPRSAAKFIDAIYYRFNTLILKDN